MRYDLDKYLTLGHRLREPLARRDLEIVILCSTMLKDFFNKLLFGGGIFFDLFKWVILFLVIIILFTKFLFTVFLVDGLSMDPALHDKEIVVLNKYIYLNGDPKRGEVAVVRYPGDPENKKYVKRVVGLPGEKLEIKKGKVYIDSNLLNEEYISFDLLTEPSGDWQLEENEYFLMGDNRTGSNDSRYFGPVEKRFLYGKAIEILFPRLRKL